MKNTLVLVPLIAMNAVFSACGSKTTLETSKLSEAWDHKNAPAHLGRVKESRFNELPLNGRAKQTPWADSYWPTYQGGLAARWHNSFDFNPFEDARMSREQVLKADQATLASLSPAEKYDLATGDYDYEFANFEIERTSPDAPTWWGLCHGWAPAALNFKEPGSVVYTNDDGLKIPFGASDVKALLTYAQQYDREYDSTRFLGARCNIDLKHGEESEHSECQDVNAGSFHLILANHLGKDQEAFVADITRDDEVWNHPIFGFQSEVIQRHNDVYEGAAPGTVEIVEVRTIMDYAVEVSPRFEAIGEDNVGQFAQKYYNYSLELDRRGRIIGGEWNSYDRPDFLWIQTKPKLTGYFAVLEEIYQQATR